MNEQLQILAKWNQQPLQVSHIHTFDFRRRENKKVAKILIVA